MLGYPIFEQEFQMYTHCILSSFEWSIVWLTSTEANSTVNMPMPRHLLTRITIYWGVKTAINDYICVVRKKAQCDARDRDERVGDYILMSVMVACSLRHGASVTRHYCGIWGTKALMQHTI